MIYQILISIMYLFIYFAFPVSAVSGRGYGDWEGHLLVDLDTAVIFVTK